MTNTFKIGDPVEIKAGDGRAITVVRGSSAELVCTWYNNHTGKYEVAVFPAAALRPFVEPSN